MTDFAKVKDHKGLVRDMNSKAILNIDKSSLEEHRRKKTLMKSLVDNSEKIQKIECDISEIRRMLSELTRKK